MKILKILVFLVLIVVSVLFGLSEFSQLTSGADVPPELRCDSETLNISVTDGESVLLSGVSAHDRQDGDLTSHILISGLSRMVGDHNVQVSYVVFDSDHNAATATRTIHYTDYVPARFEITQPLIYGENESISLLDRIRVTDCIDGDITGLVRISDLQDTEDPSVSLVDLQVTNSMGDTARVTVPILRLADIRLRPQVVLDTSLLYLSAGESFNARSHLTRVVTPDGTGSLSDVTISGTVDTATAGIYNVHYTYPQDDTPGHAVLTVVVE